MNAIKKIISQNAYKDTIGVFVFLLSFFGVMAKSVVHFDNTFINWGITFSLIFLCLKYAHKHHLFFSPHYISCTIFLLWAVYGAIKGIVYVDNYWIAKQWLLGVSCVALPCLAYVFSDPNKTLFIIRTWNSWIFPLFFLLFAWIIDRDAIHFCFGPVYFLHGIFWIWLPKKWKYWTAVFLAFMLVADIHARSQLIKALLCIAFSLSIAFDRFIPRFAIKTVSWLFYVGAICLLYLGLSGTYNIFDHTEEKGLTHEIIFSENNFSGYEVVVGEQALTDTRTFIYLEVFMSALENDYAILGRSLARGNDSEAFGADSMTGIKERYANEICLTNIFTWLGIIGVLLYSIIYFLASWLAAYRSNNIYISYLGILVAINWAYSWVENQNRFDGMNIGLWIVIGMCLSPKFRKMNRVEFENWFRSIFSEAKISPYIAYQLLRLKLIRLLLKKQA